MEKLWFSPFFLYILYSNTLLYIHLSNRFYYKWYHSNSYYNVNSSWNLNGFVVFFVKVFVEFKK